MWSIWFYFMPGATAFEAVGFKSEYAATAALETETWFQDENGDKIFINPALKQSAVIKICLTV